MATTHIRLDDECNNWGNEGRPVAILNPNSTMHERIAFCWQAVEAISNLADLLRFDDNDDIQRVGVILRQQVTPLLNVLHVIGSDTHPDKIGSAS